MMTMTNPIETAVRPLKTEAEARAEKEAREFVASVYAKLEAAGWNADAVAPFPTGRESREEYRSKKARYQAVHALTSWTDSSRGRRIGEPCIVAPDVEKADRFVAQIVEQAAAQYEAFIAKLTAKIGDCESATLAGNHVWDYSVLTVAKSGTSESWKTQTIVNRSKYAVPFYQYPTRQMKGGK